MDFVKNWNNVLKEHMIVINNYLYSYSRIRPVPLIFLINRKLFSQVEVYHFCDATTWPLEFWNFQVFLLDIYFWNECIYVHTEDGTLKFISPPLFLQRGWNIFMNILSFLTEFLQRKNCIFLRKMYYRTLKFVQRQFFYLLRIQFQE